MPSSNPDAPICVGVEVSSSAISGVVVGGAGDVIDSFSAVLDRSADLAPQIVAPGDVVLIPPGCRQRIANIGDGDLIFLAICTPRFRAEAYEDIDATELPTTA